MGASQTGRATSRTAFRAAFAIAIVFASACTLLESKDGLVGPPLSEPVDAFTGDAPTKDASAPDGFVLDGPSIGDDSSDGTTLTDASPDAPKAVATMLYSGQINPTGIFADGLNVYWVAGSPRALLKGSRDGGLPTTISHLDDVNQTIDDAFDLVVDSTYVYWTKRTEGTVFRRALAGGTNELCFTVSSTTAFLSIASNALFVSDYRSDGTGSIFRGTCGASPTTLFTSQPRATGIAAVSSSGLVYWGRNSNDQVEFGGVDGGVANTFHVVVGAVQGVAVDANALYWIAESRRIMRFDFKTETDLELFAEDAAFGDGDIAVDSQWVYWTELATGSIKKVAKLPPDGG